MAPVSPDATPRMLIRVICTRPADGVPDSPTRAESAIYALQAGCWQASEEGLRTLRIMGNCDA
jgi:hypothetical protein